MTQCPHKYCLCIDRFLSFNSQNCRVVTVIDISDVKYAETLGRSSKSTGLQEEQVHLGISIFNRKTIKMKGKT